MAIKLSLPSPHAAQDGANTRKCLVYFLTGNPGLIDYYKPFLHSLRAHLDAIETKRNHNLAFHIHSHNLAGFKDTDHDRHSLGTYLTLELFHRHIYNSSLSPALNLRSKILLFTTIAHLAKSPKDM
ncbi:hypothetical protein F5883DRAFT_647879 [Diaporthe sp. PMI_573]|nr:hypothetical protein F5883DRAFT_647879 [Diaporthaceae sp. PMI_573]